MRPDITDCNMKSTPTWLDAEIVFFSRFVNDISYNELSSLLLFGHLMKEWFVGRPRKNKS